MPQAAIFDIDGTLVDSVDLHASAWQEALVKSGHDVTFEQARCQIGKGGDQLIPIFLSEAEERDHGAEMEDWRSKLFRSKAPDIFQVALKKLGIEGPEAVAIGDTPYDAEAAGKAGIPTIGMLCGGLIQSALREGGCVAVYPGPGAFLACFD